MKTAIVETDILAESISNAWPAYYYALAQQLDECCDRNNWCINCPVKMKCTVLWNRISDVKKRLNAQDFKDYSRQVSGLRDINTKQLLLKRCGAL